MFLFLFLLQTRQLQGKGFGVLLEFNDIVLEFEFSFAAEHEKGLVFFLLKGDLRPRLVVRGFLESDFFLEIDHVIKVFFDLRMYPGNLSFKLLLFFGAGFLELLISCFLFFQVPARSIQQGRHLLCLVFQFGDPVQQNRFFACQFDLKGRQAGFLLLAFSLQL